MSMLQTFRDGYRPRGGWKRIAAWAWIDGLVSLSAVLGWLTGGWRWFAAIAVSAVLALVSYWAILTIRGR